MVIDHAARFSYSGAKVSALTVRFSLMHRRNIDVLAELNNY
jgi:hypothetical protein